MRYLITGITGTLGQAVCKLALANHNNDLIGVSRDEQKQRALPKQERLTLRLGDIRDSDRLCEVAYHFQPDVIFHFAALKCVDTLEGDPGECIKTNVIGTMNVLEVQRLLGVPRVVLSSTDKAAYPINAYGNSKALAERLVLQNPNNVVCRYGNVIASRGSVIPMFIKSLRESRRVSLTHPEMSRFLIRMEDAAGFVWNTAHLADGGLTTPEMKAAYMIHVAEAVAKILEIDRFEVDYVGIRPGEKIHECLRMAHEGAETHSHTAAHYTPDELVELLRPCVEALK